MPEKEPKPHDDVTAGLTWKDGKLFISRRAKGAHLFICAWVRGEPLALQCQEVRWVDWIDTVTKHCRNE